MRTAVAVREPNFFLVGASRAGTTSLWRYLVEHPDIFMPARGMAEKEPSHFCDLAPAWARAYRDAERYRSLFAAANGQTAVGEASTPYLVAPEVPARLRAAYPNARIIIVLRDPAERAFSLYRYLCLLGVEWATSFEQALDLEAERIADEQFKHDNPLWFYLYLYFNSGLYSAQVQRYLDVFPADQVHVVLSDELEQDARGAAGRVYRFLGVDDTFAPNVVRYNESRFPLWIRLQYWLGHDVARHPMEVAPTTLGGHVRRRAYLANTRLGQFRARAFHTNTRRRLRAAYADDVRLTARLIGKPLDSWLPQTDDPTHQP
nr:sulfotransferase [uncultured bacterium]